MKGIYLILDEQYGRQQLHIDPSTFSYEGHTDGYSDSRQDAHISFRLVDDLKVDEAFDSLKKNLRLNVNKDEYVKLRTMFESYEIDKRPEFTLRLSSGMRGIANASGFSFKAE